MAKTRIIEPHISTTTHSRERSASCRLPDALLSEQVQRLTVCTAVGAGLWTFGLVMDTIVRPLTVLSGVPREHVVIEIVAIAISVLMFLYVRYGRFEPQTKTDMGLLFFVVNAIAVALFNTSPGTAIVDSSGQQLSWNIVVILVSSMIMPTTPRKMLVTSIVAASMDPLAIWLMHLRGLPVPSVVDTFVLYMPNYACAVVGILPSRILQRLGQRLRQAQELGSYHLEELLGRGGMGEVWRGRHRLLKTSAAIKLVRPELLGASEVEAEDMLIRFEREARATATLSSPHTIRVFDFGVTADRTFYYVMEMLAGRDLASLVREFGPVPADRTLFLLHQVCQSLAEAHARGLVHRDITPANIYVCRMGLEYDFIKVLDFGLVTSSDRSMEHTLMTGAHTTTGTPAFMAPEIILEGEVDQRADVYALGCVAYYLLTGQLVFDADTSMKMFVHHLQTAPVPPSQRSEMPIPREVDELVLACLEKNPAKRPQNAAAVLRLLDRCRSLKTWDRDAAEAWWETHLTELSVARSGAVMGSERA